MLSAQVGSFFYVAFGSNLMASRLHLDNPSAEFKSQVLLEDYKLDFRYYTNVSFNYLIGITGMNPWPGYISC